MFTLLQSCHSFAANCIDKLTKQLDFSNSGTGDRTETHRTGTHRTGTHHEFVQPSAHGQNNCEFHEPIGYIGCLLLDTMGIRALPQDANSGASLIQPLASSSPLFHNRNDCHEKPVDCLVERLRCRHSIQQQCHGNGHPPKHCLHPDRRLTARYVWSCGTSLYTDAKYRSIGFGRSAIHECIRDDVLVFPLAGNLSDWPIHAQPQSGRQFIFDGETGTDISANASAARRLSHSVHRKMAHGRNK